MKAILVILTVFCAPCFSMEIATALDAKVRAANIPIDGVSIKDPANKNTWRVDFRAEATTEQRTQAAQIVAAFDPSTIQNAPQGDDVSWLKWAVNKLAPGVAGAGAAAVVLSISKRKDIPAQDPTVAVTEVQDAPVDSK